MLNALIEVHRNNIVHCDIKPQNFLIFNSEENNEMVNIDTDEEYDENNMSVESFDANSYLKITDFGLSHLIPYGQTKAYMKYKCGTFAYRAPEIRDVNR